MEKIVLNNKQSLELIPMGIETNKYENTRKLSFTSDLDYEEIENLFNAENISKIEYFSSANELLKTYIDCVSLKALIKEFNKQVEDGVVADVYTVVLEINLLSL